MFVVHLHHHQEVIEKVMKEIKMIIVHHIEVEVVVIQRKFRIEIKIEDDHDHDQSKTIS